MLSLTKSRLSGKTLFFIFILLSSFLHATIINVPTPYATIQSGINAATNSDTVLVQPGTYVENINYNGKLITVASLFLTTQNTTYISSTIIDGNSSGSVVLFCNGEDSTAVLCGFTITNGYANKGGGIHCNSSSPSLQNVTISGNSASGVGGIYGYGGGIYCYSYSSPILQNVTISGNSADYNGGGIYCVDSSPILINSILWNDSPDEIYIYTGSVTATYSDIQGGWAGTGNIDSDPLFVDPENGDYHLQPTSPCIDAGDPSSPLDPDGTIADMGAYYFNQYNGPVWHISTTGSDLTGTGWEQYPFATIQHGINASSNTDTVLVQPGTYVENINYYGKLITVGSLFLTNQDTTYISSTIIDGNSIGSVVTFTNSENSSAVLCGFTITNGSDYHGGGICCLYESSPSLQNVTISGNSADYYGGGICCLYESSPSLQNITISGNSADYFGGGIYCDYSNPSLQNVTISGNSASTNGGGIYCFSSSPTIINSILWNDLPQEIYISSGSVTATYSDIEGGWAGTGNINADPLFVDPGMGDYHLQSNSPCIDAGNPASPLDPDGTIADMGAYYFNQYNGPIWHISTTGSDLTGIGSEQFPFATIQHGINYSSDTDTVLVQPGTYVENINYNGKLITVGSLFLTTLDTTYISSTYIDGNNSGSVVTFINGEDSSAVLCGFTITNGSNGLGGGIYCVDSSPSLQNVTISGNSANVYGGGIYCFYYCNPILQNVTITSNYTNNYGGGIYCEWYSSPSMENVTITNNMANQNGGGICCDNSSPSLINSILWNNSPQEIYIISSSITVTYSDIEGGWTGEGNIDSDPLFVDSGNGDYHLQLTSPCIDAGDPASPLDPDGTISDMGAYYFNQYDGPVWYISTTGSDVTGIGTEQFPFATIQHGINISADTDTVLVHSGTYVENINYYGKLVTVASLFLTTQDTTYISSTIIDGNSSGSVVRFNSSEDSTAVLCGFTITNGSATNGGGIYCEWYSSPSLQNVTIINNFAESGGGIYCYYNCNPSLENVTISGNSAFYGGGIYCSYYSSPSLQNVTISDNTASDHGGGIYCNSSNPSLLNSILWNNLIEEINIYSGSVTATYSDIQGGWAGTGNIDSDPLFVDPANGDYHLTATSPCINTGDPESPLDPDGTIADMGAYYFDQTITPNPPQNVTVEIIGTDVHLSWDAVTGANSYKVYSSEDPYTGFVEDTSGSFAGESWSAPAPVVKKFYYVIASTETIRSNVPDSQGAYQPGRRYNLDKYINRKKN